MSFLHLEKMKYYVPSFKMDVDISRESYTQEILNALQSGAFNFVLAYNLRAGMAVMTRMLELIRFW